VGARSNQSDMEIHERTMKKIIQQLVASLGYTLVKTDFLQEMKRGLRSSNPDASSEKNDLIGNAFNVLKTAGFSPKHIIDIGANKGTWSREVMRVFDQASFTLIEPQEQLSVHFQDLLKSNKFTYLPIGVGETPGHFSFTIAKRDDSCTFRMSEEEARSMGLKQVTVEVNTIDNIVANSSYGIPDLIKIDAEGLDLEVLRGAKSVLGKTEVILVEAAVVNPVFKNDVLALTAFMREHGYRIFDITDLNRPFKKRVLWLVELMFVKEKGIVDSHNWRDND
jgi:FkbM family methyltransferase